jgi:hypothetical protein
LHRLSRGLLLVLGFMRRGLVRPVLCSACLLAAMPACGGASPDNLEPTAPSEGGAIPRDAGIVAMDSPASLPEASPVQMEAAIIDVSAPIDVLVPIVETGPPLPSVLCPMGGSSATCAPGAYCCITGEDNPNSETDTCTASSTDCAGGTPVRCAAPADCTGEVCCGVETDQMGYPAYVQVTCAATCTGDGYVPFCTDNSDCPTDRPNCQPSTILIGYTVCNP